MLCYSAIMRPGKTKTTSFSLDESTLKNLRALAARRHQGNVSAFLAEVAAREVKFVAAESFFRNCGAPPLTDEVIASIEAEWRGEPALSPNVGGRKTRRRAA